MPHSDSPAPAVRSNAPDSARALAIVACLMLGIAAVSVRAVVIDNTTSAQSPVRPRAADAPRARMAVIRVLANAPTPAVAVAPVAAERGDASPPPVMASPTSPNTAPNTAVNTAATAAPSVIVRPTVLMLAGAARGRHTGECAGDCAGAAWVPACTARVAHVGFASRRDLRCQGDHGCLRRLVGILRRAIAAHPQQYGTQRLRRGRLGAELRLSAISMKGNSVAVIQT